MKKAELEAEVQRLRAALDWCWRDVAGGMDIDGGGFQDEMEQRGILVEVPASKQCGAEFDTDTMFVTAWNAHRYRKG